MKLLKKSILLSLVAPLLFSLLSFKAIAGNDFVIIKIQEAQASTMGANPHILISDKGQIKVIDLERFGPVASNTKNLEVISGLLNQYLKDGYKIENSSSVSGVNAGLTTYILTK